MIPALLAKIGLPVLVNVVADALERVDTPVTKAASKALKTVDTEIKTGALGPETLAEANRHTEALAALHLARDQVTVAEINRSLRAEIASQDEYVRRMRPTFGYLMALTWAAQMLGVAYVIVFETERAGAVMAAMSNLSAIWAVGLSVLGIYVYKRSEDKKLGQQNN